MLPSFTLFGRVVYTYPLMGGLACIAALLAAMKGSARYGLAPGILAEAALIGAVGAFLGAHLLYTLVMTGNLAKEGLSPRSAGFLTLTGGGVYYGGLFGGLAAGTLWVRHSHYPRELISDTAAFAIPLFHGISRIGCFLAGCCYGIGRFPVQLLEAGLEMGLSCLLYTCFYRRGRLVSHQLTLYLFFYSLIRFFDEFLRGVEVRVIWWPFSTAQWISIAVLLACRARFWYLSKSAAPLSYPGKAGLNGKEHS